MTDEGAMKTVLLVDDDPVFIESISAVLETRYKVRTAANGTEAVAEVEREKPDLIITDVMMDHMSEGFDIVKKWRQNPETKELPIVMLTGVDQVYNVRMEVGEAWVKADRYLEKPVEPMKLLEVVAELIG